MRLRPHCQLAICRLAASCACGPSPPSAPHTCLLPRPLGSIKNFEIFTTNAFDVTATIALVWTCPEGGHACLDQNMLYSASSWAGLDTPHRLRRTDPLPAHRSPTHLQAKGATLKKLVLEELITLGEDAHIGTLTEFTSHIADILEVGGLGVFILKISESVFEPCVRALR